MQSAPTVNSLMDALAQGSAGFDSETNRARTNMAGRLRELTAQGLSRRSGIQNQLASQGMTHSGVNLQKQTELAGQLDSQEAGINQQFSDKLTNIARQRIAAETNFNVNSLIPR